MSEEVKNKSNSNGIYIVVILLMALGLGFLAYKVADLNKQLSKSQDEANSLKKDMIGIEEMMSGYTGGVSNDLRKDFGNLLSDFETLKNADIENEQLRDSIAKQEEKIKGYLQRLKAGKLTARELFVLRKENETLRTIMQGYVRQIDSLNTLNIQLSTDLETRTTELNQTKEERDQFKTEAEDNAAKVKKGSRLTAVSFHSSGMHQKWNNTMEETNKARNCVQIKSSFTLSENLIAPAGNRTVYMQIISPEGKVLQNRADYVTSVDGVKVAYSDRKEVNYNNERLDLAIYFDLKEEAVKGNYKVKIFCDEQLIGSDSFTLK